MDLKNENILSEINKGQNEFHNVYGHRNSDIMFNNLNIQSRDNLSILENLNKEQIVEE
jgi:hypothetical protein